MTALAKTLKAKTDDDGCNQGLTDHSSGDLLLQGARLLAAIWGTFGEEVERWPKYVVLLVYGFG